MGTERPRLKTWRNPSSALETQYPPFGITILPPKPKSSRLKDVGLYRRPDPSTTVETGREVNMSSRLQLLMLGAFLALSVGAAACGDSDGTSTETETSTSESAGAAGISLEVVNPQWSSFCASEQSMLDGDLRTLSTVPLDYSGLEEAIAPGGTPSSEDGADLLALLGTMAESWDELGAAVVDAMADVDVDLEEPGWTLLTFEEGALLVNFRYATEGSPLALPVEQEATVYSEATTALAVKAQQLGLDECSLLVGDADETEADSTSQ